MLSNPNGAPKGDHGRYSSVNEEESPMTSLQDGALGSSDGGWDILSLGLMCLAVACMQCTHNTCSRTDCHTSFMYAFVPQARCHSRLLKQPLRLS